MFGKYYFPTLCQIIYNKNKQNVESYLEDELVEGRTSEAVMRAKLEDINIGLAILFIIIHLAMFVWALSIIVIKWKIIPDWAKAVSIMCLGLNVPIFSLITVYATTMQSVESSTVKTTDE